MLRDVEPRTAGRVDSQGVSIQYQVFGEGPHTILLLPTWSIVHSDFWRYQVPHLASRFTVVAFDGRGNGASDRPADPVAYAEEQFAADALAVLDDLRIAQAAIVSSSQGGCWGLLLAATHADRVPAAVFIAPDLPFGPPHTEQASAYATFDEPQETYVGWSKWNRHYWRRDWPGFLRFFFSKCFTETNSEREIEHFISMGLETTPEVVAATVDAPALAEDEAERLAASLAAPTLVIHGTGDEITPVRRGEKLALLAGAELRVLPDSGHEPHCRSPATVNPLLDDFFSRRWVAGGAT